MKKYYLFLQISLIATLILSSCSTSNNVVGGGMFTKRKYNKGYHANLGKSHKSEKSTVADKNFNIEKESENIASLNARPVNVLDNKVETELSQSNLKHIVLDSKTEPSINDKAISVVDKSGTTTSAVVEQSEKVIDSKYSVTSKKQTESNKKNSNQDSSRSEVNLLLLVILAILIPFVAVGIATDWDILKVLLALLLTILFVLPGIIYALIVVLR